MSEFKYACPVCGQHMMCDSSQSGTVMECPTCFQKIVAPQAPAADAKFIIAGSKFTERKIPTTLTNATTVAPKEKPFPLVLVIALAVVMAAGAGVLVWRGKIFKSSGNGPATNDAAVVVTNEKPKPAEKPRLIAPPANDANWTLSLGTSPIPDIPVVGRIHTFDFIVERASFQNGALILRSGTRGPIEFGAFIHFGGAEAESLSGQTINIMPGAEKAARVQLRWKNLVGEVEKTEFTNGYALRLEFGPLANNRLPGKMYLSTPDAEKSYLVGSFKADARKPKPKAPQQEI